MLKNTGFTHLKVGGETGFNSSPRTIGTLISGIKPSTSECCKVMDEKVNNEVSSENKKEFKVETILKEAYELGYEEAKIIDTKTIVVENWVRWKCIYGCPLYNKGGCHPPDAPSVEDTQKVLKEYSKALLIKGHNGQELSKTTIKLEEYAYMLGFYKAFSLIALPINSGNT